MDARELAGGMGLSGDLPAPLSALLEYSQTHGGTIACDFELTSDGRSLANGYLRREELTRAFAVFASDGMLGLYALWRDEDWVPVYLDADWEQTGVLGERLEDLIALLTLGRDRIGMVDDWDEAQEPCEGIDDLRLWAQQRFGVATLSKEEARARVQTSRARHPDLKQWIAQGRAA